jgi:hypothetical protein
MIVGGEQAAPGFGPRYGGEATSEAKQRETVRVYVSRECPLPSGISGEQQSRTIESGLLNLNGAKFTGAGVADRLGLRFANVSMR